MLSRIDESVKYLCPIKQKNCQILSKKGSRLKRLIQQKCSCELELLQKLLHSKSFLMVASLIHSTFLELILESLCSFLIPANNARATQSLGTDVPEVLNVHLNEIYKKNTYN